MRSRRPMIAGFLFAALLSFPALPAMAAGHWQNQAESVIHGLDAAEAAFSGGDIEGAKRLVTETYFKTFEDSKLEAAIRKQIGAKRASEIEKSFSTLRKAVTAKDAAQVKAVAQSLRTAVTTDAGKLDEAKVSPDVFEVNQ